MAVPIQLKTACSDEVSLTNLGDAESHQEFKNRLFLSIVSFAAFFPALFGVLHYTNINPINDFHANVNFIYSVISLCLLISKRFYPAHFQLKVFFFLVISHLTFTSALITVDPDKFRAIWFYLLVLSSYILLDRRAGLGFLIAAIVTMMACRYFFPLAINDQTFTSMVVALIVMGLVIQAFTQRINEYLALLNKKNQQLLALAKLDPLTGVLNSRYFHEFGQVVFSLARRNRQDLSILYLDLDHFKQVNDQYSHHAGDQVLIMVADLIQQVLRDSDIFARIGGEEFCILLPQTDNAGAEQLAEKIRKQIEQIELSFENTALRVTTSIGVSSLRPEDSNLRALQMRADNNLYTAKSMGRNRVVNDEASVRQDSLNLFSVSP